MEKVVENMKKFQRIVGREMEAHKKRSSLVYLRNDYLLLQAI